MYNILYNYSDLRETFEKCFEQDAYSTILYTYIKYFELMLKSSLVH